MFDIINQQEHQNINLGKLRYIFKNPNGLTFNKWYIGGLVLTKNTKFKKTPIKSGRLVNDNNPNQNNKHCPSR